MTIIINITFNLFFNKILLFAQDAYDSLMRKKIYFQNSYGDQGEKDFTSEGFKTTFGIFTKEFKERRITDSDLIKKQKDYVTL